nr:MAG TPA: hypothetical protein [Bacteriophage sp.]
MIFFMLSSKTVAMMILMLTNMRNTMIRPAIARSD